MADCTPALKNIDLWRQRGRNLLVVQPFMDSLVTGGAGCYLEDVEGNRILDLAAGQFCSILGYGHRKFAERLKAQIESLVHIGDQYVSPQVLDAAVRLAGIAPGTLDKVLFLSTGSEANECAMRMAKTVTGRSGMLAFSRGYYGISLATRMLSSISDHPGKHDFLPAPAGHHKLLTPVCQKCPVGIEHAECNLRCLETSLETIGAQAETIAAVIVEPVVSAGGMVFPPKQYFRELRAVADRIGALLIVDEAQTGFGRCGRWFDIENLELAPDILVVSKTAGNGYPAAAVIVTDHVAQRLESRGFMHLSSHQNDPLAAAAVHAVIDIVEEDGLVKHSAEMGDYFMARLRELQARHELIKDVRGRGLMIGMELHSSSDAADSRAFELALLCERRGVHVTFTYHEPVIRFIPPLVITKADIDRAIAVLDEVLGTMRRGTSPLSELIPTNARSGPFIKRMLSRSPMEVIRKVWRTSPQQWVENMRGRQ